LSLRLRKAASKEAFGSEKVKARQP
jgi:hypothetical protein